VTAFLAGLRLWTRPAIPRVGGGEAKPLTAHDATAPKMLTPAAMRRVVAASLIGTTIEWYDFFLYGAAAALVFNKLFFPKSDPLTGTMLAFATYALGFAARPIGGVVFGHFGDRIGRKTLLIVSLLMMGVSTFAIGLLPTYRTIGVSAAWLLVALRLVQGFAVGGEWGGAVLLVAEHGEASRRGFLTSWPQAGVPAGNILAAVVLAVMAATQSNAQFLAWGWRVPFLLSAVLVAVGYWVRISVAESPAFEEARRAARQDELLRAPLIEAIRRRPRGIAVGAGLRVGENISFYIITTYALSYVTDSLHLPRSVALNAVIAGSAAECIAVPLFGLLADRIGRRPVYLIGAGGMAIWAFVFFRLLSSGQPAAIMLAVVVGLILHGAMYGPQAAFISEMFPTSMRYSGASIAYQGASIFAGSLAPIIALALYKSFGSVWPIAIYLAGASVISVVATLVARETRGLTLDEIDSA
jgi:metabolite-proton symporter